MTANQINYARHLEDVRHNKVTENETSRHNKQEEGIGWFNASELSRHNKVTESINWFNASEVQRHNMVAESWLPTEYAIRQQTANAASGQALAARSSASASTKQAEVSEERNTIEQQRADIQQFLANEQAQLWDSERTRNMFQNWRDATTGVRNIADTAAKAGDTIIGALSPITWFSNVLKG